MPRYIVERTFQNKVGLPGPDNNVQRSLIFIETNAVYGVTWVHSYIDSARMKTYCIYDAPSPEALRLAALQNEIPVDRITEVRELAPYLYTGEEN